MHPIKCLGPCVCVCVCLCAVINIFQTNVALSKSKFCYCLIQLVNLAYLNFRQMK